MSWARRAVPAAVAAVAALAARDLLQRDHALRRNSRCWAGPGT
ncbi:hypothetical protein ACGFII_01755 [Micromonospora chalcea]|nr:ferredoxin-dependent glutamate synthase [Micromonospora sp. B006]